MNHLLNYYDANSVRLIDKYHLYFEAYDHHFSKYSGKENCDTRNWNLSRW